MNNTGQKPSGEEMINAKAKATLSDILTLSESIKTSLVTEMPDLAFNDKSKAQKLNNVIATFVFFHVNKFFWEKIISDTQTAKMFEVALYKTFSEELDLDPKPFINEMIQYITRLGASGEIQFLGSKICRDVLNMKCGITLMQVGVIYGPYHAKILETCISTWGEGVDDARKVKTNVDYSYEAVNDFSVPDFEELNTACYLKKVSVENNLETPSAAGRIAGWKIAVVLISAFVSLYLFIGLMSLIVD